MQQHLREARLRPTSADAQTLHALRWFYKMYFIPLQQSQFSETLGLLLSRGSQELMIIGDALLK
eukprot:215961-Amphidinium_carterae.1